ncbi:MAG: endonuclease [Rhizobiales bacterium 63-7]|nr:endonuclease/exonuclease/phosphatase family protein [Hyphomicrobiales bacterium]OJU72200.1 MAG: endonuclease [Rhizobiales bacterium 63-7]
MMKAERPSSPKTVRILTYNVHSCIGTDRRLDIDRIAAAIAETGADIIGMQELDVGRARTGGVDQAHAIASKLRMDAHFHPALHVREERYGDAVLTALPMKLIRAAGLPSIGEPRGALWVEIDAHGTPLQLINTHLGLRRGERLAQVEALLGPDWLSHPDYSSAHRLLIGDFNSIPSSPAYRRLAAEIADVQPPVLRHRATFPSRFPVFRLDHIFASRGLACTQAQVIETSLARRASDHLPLVASFALPDARAAEQKEETRG